MEQLDFIRLYESEKPMYKAWATFVLSKIKSLITSFCSEPQDYNEWVKIPPTYRIKTTDSLVAKAFVRHAEYYKEKNAYKEITDKAGVRFVVLLTSQLQQLSSFIEETENWNFNKSREFDDWKDKDPRLFDYQSVHYILRSNQDFIHDGINIAQGTTCEVQLRTLLQHAYAELAHDTIYKGSIKAQPEVIRSFAKSMALMETTDELLCEAKATLDKACTDIKTWKDAIKHENKIRLQDINLIESNTNLEFMIDKMTPCLKKLTIKQFTQFLDQHVYISEKIKLRAEIGDYIEFKQEFILLIYFLSKRYRSTFHKKWPLDRRVLEGIYSDLGISPKWPTT